jgi:hypothetical protein
LADSEKLSKSAEKEMAQGRYIEAESDAQQVLTIREKVLGPEDHEVGRALVMVAILEQAQEKYSVAEEHCARALPIFEKTKGYDHPTVAMCLISIG